MNLQSRWRCGLQRQRVRLNNSVPVCAVQAELEWPIANTTGHNQSVTRSLSNGYRQNPKKFEMKVANGGFLIGQLTLLNGGMISKRGDVSGATLKRGTPYLARVAANQLNSVLEEIRCRIHRGESFSAIARALNNRGIRGRYGARWYHASVRAFARRHLPSLK